MNTNKKHTAQKTAAPIVHPLLSAETLVEETDKILGLVDDAIRIPADVRYGLAHGHYRSDKDALSLIDHYMLQTIGALHDVRVALEILQRSGSNAISQAARKEAAHA